MPAESVPGQQGATEPAAAFLSGLTARQAAITLLIALAFGLLGSMIELFLDWRTQRQTIGEHTRRILEVAQPSAAEAAYLLNEQLAVRVLAGLARSSGVQHVVLRDESGAVLAEERRASPGNSPVAEKLFGDITAYRIDLLHDGRKIVGQLEMHLSADAMAHGLFERILYVAAVGLFRALAICAVLILFFYSMIIRPLLQLSRQVGALDPARPGMALLPELPGHARDEIGTLLAALNRLLTASQQGLDQRDEAERSLKELTQELERRVEQRTEALSGAKREIEALNRRLASENLRMGAELSVSRKLQHMTLPTPDELEGIAGLEIAACMASANEVGGDYYDILRHRDRLRIGIGDVTGHGLESGVVMLMTQSAVRTLTTSDENDLPRMLGVLNRTLYDNVQRMGSDRNLTLALLDYQTQATGGQLRISGQHESVIVVRRSGALELIDTIELGMPLGLVDDIGAFLGVTELAIAPGDVVILYTDGITEAADMAHRLYGMERLCATVIAHRSEAAESIKNAVLADVTRHIGAQRVFDDLTLIVLKQKELTG